MLMTMTPTETIASCTRIVDAPLRTRVTIAGVIRRITVLPMEGNEALEVLVCRRAAVRLDGPGGEALRAVLDEAGDALAAGDVDAAVGANARFHAVLLQVSRSPALQSVLEPVNGRLQWLLRQHPDPQVLYEEHRAIAEAVRVGDAERAAELAGRHLRTSRQQYERAARALVGPA